MKKTRDNIACDGNVVGVIDRKKVLADMSTRAKQLIESLRPKLGASIGPSFEELKDLESLCIDFIRALERGDSYDKEVDLIRSWVCDRYPDVGTEK